MSAARAVGEPIALRLRVADPDLSGRLAALLAPLPGLRLAHEGEPADAVVTDREPEAAIPAARSPVFTGRETEVLQLLAEGASNREIARRLGISVHTAKFHVGRVLDKLDATGRTDAVAHAARQGLLVL